MATARRKSTPEICPVCGADVPPQARACPECGADERAGWNEEVTRYDGLDLPDSAFEEETAKAPAGGRRRSRGTPVIWVVVALVTVAALVMLLIR